MIYIVISFMKNASFPINWYDSVPFLRNVHLNAKSTYRNILRIDVKWNDGSSISTHTADPAPGHGDPEVDLRKPRDTLDGMPLQYLTGGGTHRQLGKPEHAVGRCPKAARL